MSRSERKSSIQTLIVGDNDQLVMHDLVNFTGVAVQVVGPVAGAGVLKLQVSNDGEKWFDTLDTPANLVSGVGFIQSESKQYAALIRASLKITAGAGDYQIISLAKDA